MIIQEIRAKSILNKSQVFDYCVNPYTGCQIGCVYCYARLFMSRYSGHREGWGEFVDAKINAPEVLKKQVSKAKEGTVWISSVCDPYQPLEATYQLTRRCLEELLAMQFPVTVQTKSDLVLRDVDLFRKFDEVEVGFTITTEDEKTAHCFEPGAAPIAKRVEALDRLHAAGIRTFAFVGPLLPGNPEKLIRDLEGKVDRILIDRMNYIRSVKGFYRQQGLLQETSDEFFEDYKCRLIFALRKRGMLFEVLF
ncbi:MAG: radical SAM protein [Deltaproteobacteria bacterium]|nr:radical SAM protein [Deltaproteobacteria bacterium]